MIVGDARRLAPGCRAGRRSAPSRPCIRRRSCPAPGRSGAAGASAGSRWACVVGQPVQAVGLQAESRGQRLRAVARPSSRAGARRASRAPAGESQLRLISAALATGGVGDALMSAMNSSTLASATARPSSTWPRSRALRSSNTVRRVTTSRRCARKLSSICFRFSSRGWPSTSATMLMPKRVLQLRLLVQVVQHDLGHLAALELDHDAHAGLVGLVADVGDAFELLLAAPARRCARAAFALFTW